MSTMEVKFAENIRSVIKHYKAIVITADVSNAPTDDRLWSEIEAAGRRIKDGYAIDQIKRRPAISATRTAYKLLGKDPNRYRPSAESLCRRVVNGKGLYRLSTMVDIINLISMETGYSIGGFDAEKVSGSVLTLGVGEAGEEFDAIGRGLLNIAGLPVYRDESGPIGTPTSDVVRTSLTESTKKLLMIVNMYGEESTNEDTVIDMSVALLKKYASAEKISIEKYLLS